MYSTETRIILSIVSQYIIWTCIRYHMNQEFIGCGQHLLMLHLPNIYLYLNNVFPLSVLSQLTFLVCFFFLVMVMSDDVSNVRNHLVSMLLLLLMMLWCCSFLSVLQAASSQVRCLNSWLLHWWRLATCCRTRFLIILQTRYATTYALTYLTALLHRFGYVMFC